MKPDEEYKDFLRKQRNSVLVVIFGVIIGIVAYFFDNLYGIGLACFLITVAITYRNWYYFSQLDNEEIKDPNTIWSVVPWLIVIGVVILGFLIYISAIFEILNTPITWFLIAFVGGGISTLNVWYPRYRRKGYLQKAQGPTSLIEEYNQLCKEHYRITETPQPDWELYKEKLQTDEIKSNAVKMAELELRLWEYRAIEAQTVYVMKEFLKPDTRAADKASLLISALSFIITFAIGVAQEVVGNILTALT